MKLFIDTNIFLEFYRFSGVELEELKKLTALAKNKDLEILLTQQVCDEFWRNREKVISDILKTMKASKLNFPFPAPIKDLDGYNEALDAAKELPKKYNDLTQKFRSEASERNLKADLLIEEIFDSARKVKISGKVLKAAEKRKAIGNPPQKRSDTSIGDAINWEALIRYYEKKGDAELYLVSADGDFSSDLEPRELKPFLDDEWCERTAGSKIVFFENLATFFKASFPHIKLASEVSVHAELDRLERSGTFARTHDVVEDLMKLGTLPLEAAERLVDIVEDNSQVRWVRTDFDVFELLRDTLKDHQKAMSGERKKLLRKWVAEGEAQWADDASDD